ncbi:hypothetical protein EDC04DRAFT_673610 [Pisolithus marmoratus]|nr:hypothetical protein EDC04DRAFT_673610 [Pisolithus marmoratus]
MVTTDKICPTGKDIVVHVLPIFAVQYVMGVLVQLRNTALLRIALLPIIPWLAWRGFSLFDFSCGNHEKAQANALFASHMTIVCMRVCVWALVQEPYVRDNVPKSEPTSVPMAFWNAWDLLLASRGIGWNWSRGIPIPRSSNETSSRARFWAYAATRMVFYGLALDAFTEAIRSFSPNFNSWRGDTILDPSLPMISRYLRALQISYLTVWMAYFGLQWGYYTLALVFVPIFRQNPSQWPPLYDKPWLSTSLSELWGRRWHQTLRFPFVSCGGIPLAYLFGPPGGVLGTFLMSAIFHVIDLRSVGRGGSIMAEIGFFGMGGVGVLLERAWSKKTTPNRRVKGVYGWIWTFSWMALWGIPVVDTWAKAGRFSADTFPGGFQPTMALLSLVLPPDVDKGFVLKCLCFGTSLPFLVYSLFTLP